MRHSGMPQSSFRKADGENQHVRLEMDELKRTKPFCRPRPHRYLLAALVLITSLCNADDWVGRLFGKGLGTDIRVPASAEFNDLGMPCVSFEPAKQFLSFQEYALWVAPESKIITGIVAVSGEMDDDDVELQLLHRKVITLLMAKFPEAQMKKDDKGDVTLTMNNGDFILVEKIGEKEATVLTIKAVRPSLFQMGIAEAKRQMVKDAGVKKGVKWNGMFCGKSLGEKESVPSNAEVSVLGLPIVNFTPERKFLNYVTYVTWVTPITKQIAAICIVAEIGDDKSDGTLLRQKSVAVLKAKYPEAREKKDEDGDITLTMENGDTIAVELNKKQDTVLVQVFRPRLLRLGVAEFKEKAVQESKSSLDAL